MFSTANAFVFEVFKVHYKDSLTYSGGIDRLDTVCYNLKQPYVDRYLTYSDPWHWLSLSLKKKNHKFDGPFLWMRFKCLKARATSRRQFTFYH